MFCNYKTLFFYKIIMFNKNNEKITLFKLKNVINEKGNIIEFFKNILQ